jgi:orotidine-5'-phosphate decarboxylase
MTAKERLIVALDVKTADEALALVSRLSGKVGMFKVGSQLFTAAGPALVREIIGREEKVFLDLKYHDIPYTVANAVAEASLLGVSLMTVHALGGKAMMEAAVGALPAVGSRLLAVTILTSHDQESLSDIGLGGPVADSVQRLALLAQQSRVDGIVASPLEAELIRGACGPDFLIVTPGIRLGGAKADDQARAATPSAAIRAGANYVVVGRPIVEANDPVAAAAAVVREMESVR